jgi:hypothetical protein
MRNRLFILILLGVLTIGLPMTAAALGLDVEEKLGAGIALGTTNNPNVTGEARMSQVAGVGFDLYLVKLGSIDLGIAFGAEFSNLNFHSTWTGFFTNPPDPFTADQTADSQYAYFNIPIALVGRVPLTQSIQLVVRAGGFIGYFIGGTSNVTYNPNIGGNGPQPLNWSNTYPWEYGLHFTGGTDIALGGSLIFAPSIQFDMGLTDTTQPIPAFPLGNGTDFKDTFWSLTIVMGFKYNVL